MGRRLISYHYLGLPWAQNLYPIFAIAMSNCFSHHLEQL